jgi:hypothetical protein
MKNHSIIFVGLDTHKGFTEVAYCLDECLQRSMKKGSALNNDLTQAALPA